MHTVLEWVLNSKNDLKEVVNHFIKLEKFNA